MGRLAPQALGEEGSVLHKAMMSGATMLPDSDAYGPDFRRVSAKIRRFDLGFEARMQGQERLIERLTPGSEADKAGIRVGDRVLVRFNTESAFRDPEMTVDAQVTRDGKTFSVTYLPRGEAIDAYQWERSPARKTPPAAHDPLDCLQRNVYARAAFRPCGFADSIPNSGRVDFRKHICMPLVEGMLWAARRTTCASPWPGNTVGLVEYRLVLVNSR